MKECKPDVLLITGMLSPYASVVEKLYKDVGKEKITMLKIERAGDVLADAVIIIFKLMNHFEWYFNGKLYTEYSIFIIPF